MIDINELRQLAQATNEHSDDRAEILAAFFAATQSDTIIELLNRLEVAEKECDQFKAAWLECLALAEEAKPIIDRQRSEIEALHDRIYHMRIWIHEEGDRSNICTYAILGEVCGYCECKRKENSENSK